VAVPFEHDVYAEPLRNSQGEAVLYKVSSRSVVSLVETGARNESHGSSAPLSPVDREPALE
jgi:hypothetical protein